MPMTPENARDNSLRDLLVSLAEEGMKKNSMLVADLADDIGVSVKHLRGVLSKETNGSLDLWDKILNAVRNED